MNGDQKRARAELAKSLKADPTLTRTMYCAAVIEQLGGNRDGALNWVEKAVKKGYSPASVQDDPAFASLHEDPRFKKLLGTKPEQRG
jgi:Tfp pilus assembly protein PilF